MIVRLGVVQMDVVHADEQANLSRIAAFVGAAASQGASLVVMP